MEFVETSKRAVIGNLSLAIGMTAAGVLEPWLIYFLKDWKWLSYILYSQVALVFLAPVYVFESVRWLISAGKTERAYEVALQIAKVNGKQLTQDREIEIKVEILGRFSLDIKILQHLL